MMGRARQQGDSAAGWSLRSWIVTGLIVVPVILLQGVAGFEYSSWVRWGGITIAFLVGAWLLISPRTLDIRPTLARALGALVAAAAAINAYSQFTSV